MPNTFEKIKIDKYPIIPLRSIIAFPNVPVSIELGINYDINVAKYADANSLDVFLCPLDNVVEIPSLSDYHNVGTVCKVKQTISLPDGSIRIIVEGISRASIDDFEEIDGILFSKVISKDIETSNTPKCDAIVREIKNDLDKFLKILPEDSKDLSSTLSSIKSNSIFCDFLSANILISYTDKLEVLDIFDIEQRLDTLCYLIKKELDSLENEAKIHSKVRKRLDAHQRDFYIREQIKVLKEEIGEDDDDEIVEYTAKINSLHIDNESKKHLLKEVDKLSKSPYTSSEAAVIRSYLDICLDIPFDKYSSDEIDILKSKEILDRDHYDLTEIKNRILEYLAVKKLNPNSKGQIICFVGAPGTGKTSICKSIAESLGREYVRVCLGGIRDEADIRGHRKTYIGSMPGRIIDALIHAKTMNPLIVLDEIDKLSRDGHGDPSSALLEVLDSAQNNNFRDHFVEIPVDLSNCIFIATANEASNIPGPLYDRMDIVKFDIYNRVQKLNIAKKHLIKKQRLEAGLKYSQIRFTDKAIYTIIDEYTAEAGVRTLNRLIASIMRKVAVDLLANKFEKITITPEIVKDYLGSDRIEREPLSQDDEVGVVNGLAYTSVGGTMLKVEALSMDGDGKLELTGSLGDVMKESAKAAYSYIRKHTNDFNIPSDFHKNTDIHLHFPEGATPKDGPSAGITILTAMVSELSNRPVKRDIAMTGEISLRGKILPIGGLKEKAMAAYENGIKTVLIPKGNEKDIEKVDTYVKNNVHFIPCELVSEAIKLSLN